MSIGIWQILLVVALVILLFGRGKISELMGDVAKGIKSFRQGLKDDESPEAPKAVGHDETPSAQAANESANEREGDKVAR
jgi:sec-independent protein translocase protein TatA